MIIALSGIPLAGKDTVGNLLARRLNDLSKRFPEFRRLANKDPEGKLTLRPGTYKNVKFAAQGYGTFKIITGKNYGKLKGEEKEEYRPLMKSFLESTKDVFGKDVWAKALVNRYPEDSKKHWVITDLRFFEEISVLRDQETEDQWLFLIRIRRTCEECFQKDTHTDECSLNNLTPEEIKLSNFLGFDMTVDNDDDPEFTVEKIIHFLAEQIGFDKTKLIDD